MRRSASLRSSTNGGVTDKKTKTPTIKGKAAKLSKHRSSNKLNGDSQQIKKLKNNNTVITDNLNYKMPVYNIIARRHKVRYSFQN